MDCVGFGGRPPVGDGQAAEGGRHFAVDGERVALVVDDEGGRGAPAPRVEEAQAEKECASRRQKSRAGVRMILVSGAKGVQGHSLGFNEPELMGMAASVRVVLVSGRPSAPCSFDAGF